MGLSAYRLAAKARIDAELKARVGQWFPSLPPAHEDALHGILAEGKRLRGSLTCLVAEALGGSLEQALPHALAVELVQAASLVHDDFVDGDTVRRGRPAAWTLLSARRAVLVADLIFATAIETMSQAGSRECATLVRSIADMAQGALQESLIEGDVEDAQRAPGSRRGHRGSVSAAVGRRSASAGAGVRRAAELHDVGLGGLGGLGRPLLEELRARDYRRVFAASIREGLLLLDRAGIAPATVGGVAPRMLPVVINSPDWLFNTVFLRKWKIDAKARSSMTDDLATGRRTEIDYLNGELARLAERLGVDAPVNRRIVELVRRAEAGAEPLSPAELRREALGG